MALRTKETTFGPSHLKCLPCAMLYNTLYHSPDISHLTTASYRKNKVLVKTSFRNNGWLVCFPIQFKYSHLKVVRGWLKSPKSMAGRWQGKERGRCLWNSTIQLQFITTKSDSLQQWLIRRDLKFTIQHYSIYKTSSDLSTIYIR